MTKNESRDGILFVLSAPSGVGKTTVANLLLERVDKLTLSVSHTTRAPRDDEKDGVHYHFVNDETFGKMVAAGEFLEWAVVHGNRYGTSYESIRTAVAKGDVLLDVDVQGAEALRGQAVMLCSILLKPPSMEELERRLRSRNDESEESVQTRLGNAERELAEAGKFDHVIVNDDLEVAVSTIENIIATERGGE